MLIFLIAAGHICLSLSIFGREVSARQPASISTFEVPPVTTEDNLGVEGRNSDGAQIHSRTSSMGTDSSVEYTNFPDKPGSPRLTVIIIASNID